MTGAVLLGRYAIQRKLGSGSLGSVYLAIDRHPEAGHGSSDQEPRRVALKVSEGQEEELMSPRTWHAVCACLRGGRPEERERLTREARR
jgi:serine/threonine protein kinase